MNGPGREVPKGRKFRLVSETYEAMPFDGKNAHEIKEWVEGAQYRYGKPDLEIFFDGIYLHIRGQKGRGVPDVKARVGEWVVKNNGDNFWSCDSDRFYKTFEPLPARI